MKKRVLVGLSGGVDSSVVALLLKQQRWDVSGAFIKSWFPEGMPCTWRQERRDAIRVAAHLDIPFTTIDAEDAYKQHVADAFVSEYRRGRVPNPDVLCNREVKFAFLAEEARRQNIPYIATGHYARSVSTDGSKGLYKGVDAEKDQSYFLWAVPQALLEYTLFPVGELQKTEVRTHAQKAALPTAAKKDSQGVCFLGPIDMREYLKTELGRREGVVYNERGEQVGVHEGAHLYTIGQRHGFSITTTEDQQKPHYVIGKDIKKNTITVSSTPEVFGSSVVRLDDVSWLAEQKEGSYEALIRYRAKPTSCQIKKKGGAWQAVFPTPQEIAPGQSIVWYKKERLCGGGVAIEVQ